MIYFDNNATTQLDDEVKKEMIEALDIYGNASSQHYEGQRAKNIIDIARKRVADFLGARTDEIVFTSGGTESDNIALIGSAKNKPKFTIITTPIEHSAVLNPAKMLRDEGCSMHYLRCGRDGAVAGIPERISGETPGIVSVMLVNNETGVIQPVGEIAEEAGKHGFLMHTDAVQAAGKIPVNVRALGVDMLSLSSHKLHGPKGIGALYIKDGLKLAPVMLGGGQEGFLRPGTENVPAIAGFGKACELAMNSEHTTQLRDEFESLILNNISDTFVNGADGRRVWNTSNICFPGVKNSNLVARLDADGVAASAASACMALSANTSRVLTSMGLTPYEAGSSVRFSFSKFNTLEEVGQAAEIISRAVADMRKKK